MMTRSTDFRRAARAASITAAWVLSIALFLPAAYGQNAKPPEPENFKAIQQPSGPATLTTAPAASLLTPATGAAKPTLGFTGGRMVMTNAVWRSYVRYLQSDVATGYGFFMITADGTQSDVKSCKNYSCQISPVSQMTALSECQAKMRNQRCIVFAEGRDIKYAYQVLP